LIDGPFWDYNMTIYGFDGAEKALHRKVHSMAVSPDSTMMILSHETLKLLIRDIATNRQIDEILVDQIVFALEIFPNSQRFTTLD
jgi:hypothetical protein